MAGAAGARTSSSGSWSGGSRGTAVGATAGLVGGRTNSGGGGGFKGHLRKLSKEARAAACGREAGARGAAARSPERLDALAIA